MRTSVLIILLAGTLLFVGCTSDSSSQVEELLLKTPTIQVMAISTGSPSTTPIPITIAPTILPTTMPSTSTPTATKTLPTVTPAPTPFPTFDIAYSDISEATATENLIELLKTNGNCQLPCWWGIELGETEVGSLEQKFVPLGFDWARDFKELDDTTPYKASIYIIERQGKVQEIQVKGGAGEETYDRNEAWRPYAIPEVLNRLGTPHEVYVYYPFRFDPGGLQAYRLFLYYPDLGVEIDYLGKATLIDDRPGWAQACPHILETDEINLFLYQPNTVADYRERTLPVTSLPLPELPKGTDPYDIVSWEQATESSLEQFWQLFTETEEGTSNSQSRIRPRFWEGCHHHQVLQS